jgi:hypothetical protein
MATLKGTGVRRDTIRLIRHGKAVKRSTYSKVIDFLKENARPSAPTLLKPDTIRGSDEAFFNACNERR